MRWLLPLMVLSGCANTPPGDYWVHAHPPYKRSQVEIRYVDMAGMIELGCKSTADACAVRQPERCLVVIWSGRKGDDCVLSHELRHCAGWSHPRYPYLDREVCG